MCSNSWIQCAHQLSHHVQIVSCSVQLCFSVHAPMSHKVGQNQLTRTQSSVASVPQFQCGMCIISWWTSRLTMRFFFQCYIWTFFCLKALCIAKCDKLLWSYIGVWCLCTIGPYRTCPWHFKCLNKIGQVELVPTFATIRFWHRTTTEHVSSDGVQTFCSQLSKHSFARRTNVMLPRSFLLRAAAFLLETFQLNNGYSGFWGCFPPLNSAAGKCFGPTNALHGVIRQLGSRRRPQYFWIPPRPHTPGPRGFLIATARIVS